MRSHVAAFAIAFGFVLLAGAGSLRGQAVNPGRLGSGASPLSSPGHRALGVLGRGFAGNGQTLLHRVGVGSSELMAPASPSSIPPPPPPPVFPGGGGGGGGGCSLGTESSPVGQDPGPCLAIALALAWCLHLRSRSALPA